MGNVLPQGEKIIVQSGMRARFLLTGSLVITGAACVAILSILPALISVRIARASLESSVQESQGSLKEERAAALRAQNLITALGPLVQATSSPIEALSVVLAQKPVGISLTTITYSGGAKGTLVLSGTSDGRDAVNAFRDALGKTGRFSNVAIPVAALVGTQGGRFTVTLSGVF